MWVDAGLLGAAVVLTTVLWFSAGSLRKRATTGCSRRGLCPLVVAGALWAVLGALLFLARGAGAVPAMFVFLVYLVGGIGVIASLFVLRQRSTDPIAAFGLRAGILAIPLVLILFAGFNI